MHLFSERLGAEGDLDGALAHAQETLALYKALEHASPGPTTAVVRTLVTAANRYADIGDREGALAPARDAVMLQRSLADAEGSASLPTWLSPSVLSAGASTTSVTERGARAHAGRRRHLPAARRTNAGGVPPGLAAALNNLAANLAAVGERRSAVPPAREAVDIHLSSPRRTPMSSWLLSSALTNLASSLKAIGSHVEALPHAEAAVRANRKVAERHPSVLRSALAGS
ncbi:tetratricopeptide repeat protein [Streptomyces sp. M10(2022)]